jgi:hypothetical protein
MKCGCAFEHCMQHSCLVLSTVSHLALLSLFYCYCCAAVAASAAAAHFTRFVTFGKEGVIDVNGPAEVTPTAAGERIKATFTEAELKWNGLR